ncbi:MAG: DUF4835 family protein [bacterium]
MRNTRFIVLFLCILAVLSFASTSSELIAGQLKANVRVIIDKLPIDKQEKMREFDRVIKNYIEEVDWLEDDDLIPLEIALQLFLTDTPSNIEDRYRCEFLISSTDVQYFDKRVRFPYREGEQLLYSDHDIGPLTGVINFYVNMVLGSELDKERAYGGDFYYKKAQGFVALGKFVRTEFILGWTERDELVKRIFTEPFKKFRKMKDLYFYGLYVREKNIAETRKNLRTAVEMIGNILKEKADLDEIKQFLNAHYLEIIDIFKDDRYSDDVFEKMIEIDPDHRELYQKYTGGS